MTSIVNMFGRNTIVNDYLVHKFVCSQLTIKRNEILFSITFIFSNSYISRN